ncbi:hypothetical protein PM082_000700 [Marasmius tenuissimus]|nr:hypothetical protein PM082_000700 [Marasmius tenuissimus]
MAAAKALRAARILAVDAQESSLEFTKIDVGGAEVDIYVSAKQASQTTGECSMRNSANKKEVLGIGGRGPG